MLMRSVVQALPALAIVDQDLAEVFQALVLALRYVLQCEYQFVLNDERVVPESFRVGQRVGVYILDVRARCVNTQHICLLLAHVRLIVSAHHHDLVLSNLSGCIRCQGHELFSLAFNQRVDHRPLPVLLVVHFDGASDGVVIGDAPDLVDVPAVEGAAGEGAALIVHGFDFFHLVADDVEPLAPVRDHLIIQDAYIRL